MTFKFLISPQKKDGGQPCKMLHFRAVSVSSGFFITILARNVDFMFTIFIQRMHMSFSLDVTRIYIVPASGML